MYLSSSIQVLQNSIGLARQEILKWEKHRFDMLRALNNNGETKRKTVAYCNNEIALLNALIADYEATILILEQRRNEAAKQE